MSISNVPPTTTGIAILTLLTYIAVELIRARVAAFKAEKSAKAAQQSVAVVEHEVTPNSGKSLRDQVDRILAKTNELDSKLDSHSERLARVETIVEIANGIHHKKGE